MRYPNGLGVALGVTVQSRHSHGAYTVSSTSQVPHSAYFHRSSSLIAMNFDDSTATAGPGSLFPIDSDRAMIDAYKGTDGRTGEGEADNPLIQVTDGHVPGYFKELNGRLFFSLPAVKYPLPVDEPEQAVRKELVPRFPL